MNKEKIIVLAVFLVIATLIGAFSLNTINAIRSLSSNVETYHRHPFIVSNSIEEIKSKIKEIQLHLNELKDKPIENIAYTTSIINHIEGDIFFILGLHKNVEDRYLGDREDLVRLADIITELENNFKLLDESSLETKTQINSVSIALQNLEYVLTPIELFADNKAEEIYDQTIQTNSKLLLRLSVNLIVIFFSMIVIAVFVVSYLEKKNRAISKREKTLESSIKCASIPMLIQKKGTIKYISDEWLKITGYSISSFDNMASMLEKIIPGNRSQKLPSENSSDYTINGTFDITTNTGEIRKMVF
jgi:hypothetical protein